MKNYPLVCVRIEYSMRIRWLILKFEDGNLFMPNNLPMTTTWYYTSRAIFDVSIQSSVTMCAMVAVVQFSKGRICVFRILRT